MFSNFNGKRETKRSKKDRSAGPAGRGGRSAAGRNRTPLIELLEQRAMLTTTFTPAPATSDGAAGSLRADIAASNADAGTQPDIIQLTIGTYNLTSVTGQLTIASTNHTLIIQGTGIGTTLIEQQVIDRVFNIAPGATVIFEDLEITGGMAETDSAGGTTEADGGGILNAGTLTLSDVEVDHNRALETTVGESASGGGIYNTGSLTLEAGSIVDHNRADGATGPAAGTGGYAYGGGIFSNTDEPVQISDSTISNDAAAAGAGAAGVGADGGVGGTGYGGGVYISNTGTTSDVLNDDTFIDNSADGGDGGTGDVGFNGGPAGYAQGGGAYLALGPTTISNSTLSGNVVNGGTGETGTTFGVGGFAFGGGAEVNGTGSQLLNDTIYGNSAIGGSGSTTGNSYGAGVNDASGGLTLVNDTVAANVASVLPPVAGGTVGTPQGGGINNYLDLDPALDLYNTLDATNTGGTSPDFNGTAALANSNFIGDGTGASGFSTAGDDNQVGTTAVPLDPMFVAAGLANNGGNTQTVALKSGSTALGAGNPAAAIAAGLTTDQRGLARIVGGKTDIGALETQFQGPIVTNATTTEGVQTTSGLVITPAASDTSVTNFQITNINGGTLFQANGTTPINAGDFITLAQGAAGLKFTPTAGSLAGGSFTVQESTSASAGGLGGPTTSATITVGLAGATVTSASTTENTQTASGLVITPAAGDTSATFFQITGITNGTVYQHDGTTVIPSGSFITAAQGAAGLKFTPTTGLIGTASFSVQESTTNAVGGLNGPIKTTTIVISFAGPTATNATTTENKQSTSGLVITPGANDSTAAFFQITGITGGTLFQADGTTAITNGSFITVAQGAAGLKFTPTPGSIGTGSFNVQESTTNAVGGLNGPTVAPTIAISLAGPTVTGATTTENTQTASGLVITPGANDSTAAFFQISGISGGTLFQHDGTTAIASGSFISLAQGAAGLKFTPTTGSVAAGSFNVEESTTNAVGGLSGTTATATINVTLAGPTVTGSTTTENTQTASGLVITPGASDSTAAFFQITGITGGTLFQHDGTTAIASGSFITAAQGAAGLKFTPTTGSVGAGSFNVEESTTNAVGGLSGATATATINVALAGPTVTGASTTENTQTTSGLVITPGANDSTAAFFQITGISGGTLFQHDGTTAIASGSFITLAQGAAGLRFTPTTGSLAPGGFSVQESTTNAVGGLGGATAATTITIALAGPTVMGASTSENTQTTSGLVITPGTNDSTAAFFQITGISGGTLFQHDGTTAIASGSFITLAQGAAGLKFTPTTGSLTAGSFGVQESTTNAVGGLSGPTVTVTINVSLIGPSVTSTTTTENTQTTSGLVITPGTNDSTAAFFQITGITGGTLFQNNGTTPIASGSFITLAQGAAGLKFTPTTGSLAAGSFNVEESTTNAVGGLSGATATATINVAFMGPTVSNAATTENTQTGFGLVIARGPGDSTAAFYQITGITGGTLFQNNGTTAITNGSFITTAQGAAGLRFTPTAGSVATGSFVIQESTTAAVGGLSGPTATATINVTLSAPIVTGATTTENKQTTSGLVIMTGANDSTAAFFQITGITGGTLFQNDGTTPISNGSFITLAQGAAGLKFTPTSGSLTAGSFDVRESTSASVAGLSGVTLAVAVNVTLAGPTVTSTSTTENTQTTSGLVIIPGANDSSAAFFQITGITGGTLFQNNGTTAIANGSFITVAQGAVGLKFTPTTGSLADGSFVVQESTTAAVGGLSGSTVAASIAVVLSGPSVTNATTIESTQSVSGLVITPGANDSTAAFFQITSITGGTLFQNNGTTPISNGSFITVAQGAAGLKFTPNSGTLVPGGFTVRESTTAAVGGLSGPTARAAIAVTLSGPTVTGATTAENTQTSSGLVIAPGANDSSAAFFQITGITGGALFQHNGTTAIANGSFITVAQGAAGLKFTPTAGSLAGGSFNVEESTSAAVGGLSGAIATATISVKLSGPSVTGASTKENTQTTSGLVITRAANDSTAAFFQITGITGGTLFQNNGTTAISNGSFITVAQGAAGLKFTPTTGSLSGGSFNVQESTSAAVGGVSGPTATATINVTLSGPTVTSTTTTENTQSVSGLVIKPGASDSTAAFFQITGVAGGTLYQNNGTTVIANGSFITLAQGAAGLKFTPTAGSLADGSFDVQESTTNTVAGLSGTTVAALIAVVLNGPSVSNATTTENTQTTSGLVISPGDNDSTAAFFRITSITGGTLFQNDGTTAIPNGSFITLAQGEAGLKFTPNTGSMVAGGFSVRESTTAAVGGLSGPTARAAIAVTLTGATVTGATTTENTQSTSGLVLTPGVGDTTDTFFRITGVSGGTLFQNDGTTAIPTGSFITLAQGAAGLKFTPTAGSLVAGGISVQESMSNSVGGLSGPFTSAAIAVTLSKPTVTGATTTEGAQTTSGLVITSGPNDSSAAFFHITGITGGTLYQHDGTTVIPNGSYITLAQGEAGLKFTPNAGSMAAGGFSVRQSTTTAASGLSGPTTRVAIAVTLGGPTVTGATTPENTQTTSGLVITPAAGDSSTAFFQITSITGGTLFQNNGTTPILSGSFITLAQGAAGLKFTPTTGSLASGSFSVQESTTNAVGGLSGTATAVSIAVTAATTQANVEVDLSSYYNLAGIAKDHTRFSGGLDGAGNALAGSAVGTSQTWNDVDFGIAAGGNVNNVVQAAGQTIALPSGSFSKLEFLGASVNGNQPDQTFTVNYTDGTSQTFTQSISDWHTPQSYSGETTVVSSTYRDTHQGGRDCKGPFDVYGYSITLDPSKTAESITLPGNSHVEVLAITMVATFTSTPEPTITASTAKVHL